MIKAHMSSKCPSSSNEIKNGRLVDNEPSKKEELLKFRLKVMQSEEERLGGARTMSLSEAKKELEKRAEKS